MINLEISITVPINDNDIQSNIISIVNTIMYIDSNFILINMKVFISDDISLILIGINDIIIIVMNNFFIKEIITPQVIVLCKLDL